ncbi:unnamed protein product [Notodromas monacha]|uniref:RNA cytidine acetyltransferase n=1 Tax=Notodromas monacha TaxID=399045 RepID=A0A7R9GEV7_9CRUS|nr:unnamed protein product [Notodromas monacha]CAG0920051.1 unnamed protein product [Notodromas monacha]
MEGRSLISAAFFISIIGCCLLDLNFAGNLPEVKQNRRRTPYQRNNNEKSTPSRRQKAVTLPMDFDEEKFGTLYAPSEVEQYVGEGWTFSAIKRIALLRTALNRYDDILDMEKTLFLIVSGQNSLIVSKKKKLMKRFKSAKAKILSAAIPVRRNHSIYGINSTHASGLELDTSSFMGYGSDLYAFFVEVGWILSAVDEGNVVKSKTTFLKDLYLEDEFRESFGWKLDFDARIFHICNRLSSDDGIIMGKKGPHMRVYSVVHKSYPGVLFRKGHPGHDCIAWVGNYVPEAWNDIEGCLEKPFEGSFLTKLNKNQEEDLPSIFISLVVHSRHIAEMMPWYWFLHHVKYPKKNIHLHITMIGNTPEDFDALMTAVDWEFSDTLKEISGEHRADEHSGRWLANHRKAVREDFYLLADSRAHLTSLNTLGHLIALNRSIVAPMLFGEGQLYGSANFFDVYSRRNPFKMPEYDSISKRKHVGIWAVPCLFGVVLVDMSRVNVNIKFNLFYWDVESKNVTFHRVCSSMMKKKLDNRIRVMIENCVSLGHRSFFVIVGDQGRDQVVILHHMLSKAQVKARPSVLWCYKKDLGFCSTRKKKMRQLQKKIQSGKLNVNDEDPFELFVSSTSIRYCYYHETHRILGNTYGMCVLQDFEAVTPNLLARTIETVEGGGMIVLLLKSVSSLKQLYTMTMDVHSRFRTEAHDEIVARFNERFILSLMTCKTCIVLDDKLNILPLSSHVAELKAVTGSSRTSATDPELRSLQESLQDTQPVGVLVNLCKTLDQAKAVLKFIDAISEKSLRATVSLTAARGRGKSASLGVAVAGALAFGYSNIFVTSPSPENLSTFWEFVFKGFDALEYQEHIDYDLVQSTNPEFNKAIIRVNVYRDHRQTIQYIHPTDGVKLGQAELVVIDEAAAIPLPLVKSLLGPYLVFMASTINGYEGTGRSLSLKLLQQLRIQSGSSADKSNQNGGSTGSGQRSLHEVALEESIRYRPGDPVESWLTELLCLNATDPGKLRTFETSSGGCPLPEDCDLYYVNRDTLFCFHKASELFLHRLMSLYVSSHYKNSPNDLQMLSDAPAHHLFCLLPPVKPGKATLPEVLCVIQVCLEGNLSRASVKSGFAQGKKAHGDLIPWTVAQQFNDNQFPQLAGARVVRIATHPDFQNMGYGSKALALLEQYYEGKIAPIDVVETETSQPEDDEDDGLLNEKIGPRDDLPPLLLKLSERQAERLDYLGVSFGATESLVKFWRKAGYIPVYLRQTCNDLTGEHSCIMLKTLKDIEIEDDDSVPGWLSEFWLDFRRRFANLLGSAFRKFEPKMALTILGETNKLRSQSCLETKKQVLTKSQLEIHLSAYDVKRLELYAKNLSDFHLILDLLPTIGRLYFTGFMGDLQLSAVQSAILIGMALEFKSVEEVAGELEIEVSQLLGLFNRIIRKAVTYFNSILENSIIESSELLAEGKAASRVPQMVSTNQSLDDELEEAAKEIVAKQKKGKAKMKSMDLSEFQIKGNDSDWSEALKEGGKSSVVIKTALKRPLITESCMEPSTNKPKSLKMKKMGFKKR